MSLVQDRSLGQLTNSPTRHHVVYYGCPGITWFKHSIDLCHAVTFLRIPEWTIYEMCLSHDLCMCVYMCACVGWGRGRSFVCVIHVQNSVQDRWKPRKDAKNTARMSIYNQQQIYQTPNLPPFYLLMLPFFSFLIFVSSGFWAGGTQPNFKGT